MTRYIIEVEDGTVTIGDGECQQTHYYHEDADEEMIVLFTLADFLGIDLKELADYENL